MSKRLNDGWKYSVTFLAGACNACAILVFSSTISHYSGNLTLSALAIAQKEYWILASLALNICMFILGAMIAGHYFYNELGVIKPYYLSILIIFGGSLIVSHYLFTQTNFIVRILAFGMGVLNGIYLKENETLIRTTHMSGYLTDIGVNLGRFHQGDKVALANLSIALRQVAIFVSGCLSTAIIYQLQGDNIIYIIGIMYISVGSVLQSIRILESRFIKTI